MQEGGAGGHGGRSWVVARDEPGRSRELSARHPLPTLMATISMP